eukprot:4600427-Amphidinium_carterae.1
MAKPRCRARAWVQLSLLPKCFYPERLVPLSTFRTVSKLQTENPPSLSSKIRPCPYQLRLFLIAQRTAPHLRRSWTSHLHFLDLRYYQHPFRTQ